VTVAVSQTVRPHDTITVTLNSTVKTSMMRLLHVTSGNVKAKATAQVGPAGSAYHTFPLVLNDNGNSGYPLFTSIQFQAWQGNCNGTCYNFDGITPPGTQTYQNALVNGIDAEIQLNHWYPTNAYETTTLSSWARAALQARIDANPSETPTNFAPGSSRVIILPIINGCCPVAPGSVQIIYLRAFFVQSINTSGVITGQFVADRIAEGTIGGSGVPDTGIYVIKLTK
jgi:hypothetical protein